MVAAKLRSLFKDELAEADNLTEVIIESAVARNTFGFIYEAMMGYKSVLAGFHVGMNVAVDSNITYYGFTPAEDDGSGKRFTRERIPINFARIITIEPYKDGADICLEFEGINRDGERQKYTEWVHHAYLVLPE